MFRLSKTSKKFLFYAVVLFVTISSPSCSGKSKNEITVFKALNESLDNSNKAISQSTEVVYVTLQQKLQNPATSQKAMLWDPHATALKKYTTELITFIEDAKNRLESTASLIKDGKRIFNEDDKNLVSRIFDEQITGDRLYEKLLKYKKDVAAIDAYMDSSTRRTLCASLRTIDQSMDGRHFTKNFFHGMPVIAALATLSKFENDVKICEYRMLSFWNSKMTNHLPDYYSTYSAIIAQSSTYVRAGEEMEITAGVGSFSKSGNPDILIDGKMIDMNEDRTAVYKFKVKAKPGKYSVPVRINYTDQDGQKQLITKDVEYTVR